MHFRIIKLTNNDDPKEFTLEITRMRDIRQRIGIIEAGYLDYLELKGRRKYAAMDKLTNPAPPPLTFDRKKEGYNAGGTSAVGAARCWCVDVLLVGGNWDPGM